MRLAGALVVGSLLVVGLGACNGRHYVPGSASASVAPEDLRTTAAKVAAGLTEIVSISATVAATAGVDNAASVAADEKIESVWSSIEGTVRSNDSGAYLSFEDNFALLANASKKGDAKSAGVAAVAVRSTVSLYLKKYPA